MKALINSIALSLALLVSTSSNAGKLDDLLQQVKQQQVKNQQVQNQREEDFSGDLNHWRKELATAQDQFDQVKAKADQLNAQFDQQETQLGSLEQELGLATDNLGEVFGVVRQMTGEFSADFANSIISA